MESFNNGVYNENTYNSLEKRRATSIEVCFLGWLLESFLTIIIGIIILLQSIGLEDLYMYPHLEFFQTIVRFVVIPFVHVMNDEDTKTVMTEESWYQGIRHALGVYYTPKSS